MIVRLRAALLAGAAFVFLAAPAAGQSPDGAASRLVGRWALTLEGGAPPRVRGELRLRDSAGTLAGTIYLETRDSAPVPLREVQSDGERIEFLAELDPGMRFVGRVRAGGLGGEALGGAGEQMQTWTASRLSESIEFYPALPRFTLRQIITGLPDSIAAIPGAWVAAAKASAQETDSLGPRYVRASAAAGLVPLPLTALPADGGPYLLGVYRREQTGAALIAALGQLDRDLASPQLRAAFRRLFATRAGEWLPDVHAVALDRARQRSATLNWADARPALVASGWIPADAANDPGTLPYAIYRLAHLESVDSVEFRLAMERMAVRPESARAVSLLLDGYGAARDWYPEALRFLLAAPWVRGGVGPAPRSIAQLMAEFWGVEPDLPELRTAWFGYPQAVPRYGAPPQLLDRLVVPENWTAREWLEHNGHARLLTILQRLGADSLTPTTLERGGRALRITTVRRQARESINGFLEPHDAIVADPGVPPLLALGTVVHEWQHLMFERARRSASPAARPAVFDEATSAVTLRPSEPVIAEGLAEWSTEVILAPAAERLPIIAVAEPLKRARLAQMSPGDPHIHGYLLARTLAGVVPAREAAALLVEASVTPARVLESRAVARAWRRHADAPGWSVRRAAALVLVPETRFTIEGGWPDPIGARIRF